ncbi:MAG: hypothetical protein JJ992_15455, partial [Planctomycetes bacterium]|nr:hypothetical protein [Planctomycetota bacterium]
EQTLAYLDWQQQTKRPPPSPPLVQGYFTSVTRDDNATSAYAEKLYNQFRRRMLARAARQGTVASPGIDAKTQAQWLERVRALAAAAYGVDPSTGDAAPKASKQPWSEQLASVMAAGSLRDCGGKQGVDGLSRRLKSEAIDLEGFFAESARLYGLATQAWELERFLLFQYLGEYYRDLLTTQLPGLARFDLACEFDGQLCRVLVNASCPSAKTPANAEGANADTDDCPAPSAFIGQLSSEDTIFFTYAATPKANARTVLSTTDDGLSVGARASATLPGNDSVGGAMRGGYAQQQSEAGAGRQIQVMGFGGTGRNNTQPRFGWLIEPPSVGLEPQPIQQSLTAIVSLPSWWDQIWLRVRTCWRGDGGFPKDEVREGSPCRSDGALESVFKIHLPWNIKDINRKFNYEIRRVPFIESTGGDFGLTPFPVYHVGQPDARLLIEGGDLWRSTMVTLGSQRADEILVLPNMRGIIATFKTIERSSRPEPCRTQVPIRVWTSEGVTMEDAAQAIIYNSELRDDDTKCGGPGRQPADPAGT